MIISNRSLDARNAVSSSMAACFSRPSSGVAHDGSSCHSAPCSRTLADKGFVDAEEDAVAEEAHRATLLRPSMTRNAIPRRAKPVSTIT